MASPRLPESHPEEPSVQLVNEGPHGAVTFLGGMRGASPVHRKAGGTGPGCARNNGGLCGRFRSYSNRRHA